MGHHSLSPSAGISRHQLLVQPAAKWVSGIWTMMAHYPYASIFVLLCMYILIKVLRWGNENMWSSNKGGIHPKLFVFRKGANVIFMIFSLIDTGLLLMNNDWVSNAPSAPPGSGHGEASWHHTPPILGISRN